MCLYSVHALVGGAIKNTSIMYVCLYSVHALVGGAISIRDPYICAVHESVPTNRTLSYTSQLSVQ